MNGLLSLENVIRIIESYQSYQCFESHIPAENRFSLRRVAYLKRRHGVLLCGQKKPNSFQLMRSLKAPEYLS